MELRTTDLCDTYPDKVKIVAPMQWKSYGGLSLFNGQITTLKCYEDNSLVRKILGENGKGRILVIDGGGSMRCALLGDMLAELAIKNEWNGVFVYGCIRDSATIGTMPLGVIALDVIPLKSIKRDEGQIDIPVCFADVEFVPNHFIYCDEDGIIVSKEALSL